MSLAQPVNSSLRFRRAEARDAEPIAALHAESWRRHYRGAYADSFLDGDVVSDRRSVWSARLAAPAGTETILAAQAGQLVGFIHVVFDDDPSWGSLIDNLHVAAAWHRQGIGARLLSRAAAVIGDRAAGPGMYLWVLEQNASAQQFYRACGAACAETVAVSPPNNDPARLHGNPRKVRMVWADSARGTKPQIGARGRQ
jgi:ribosomal protein S18 acetylase RimI-like enzyme